jgi:hypothetical protein
LAHATRVPFDIKARPYVCPKVIALTSVSPAGTFNWPLELFPDTFIVPSDLIATQFKRPALM